VVVPRSSSDGSAIIYVLPVLWTTSCFHIMERIGPNQRRLSSSSPVAEQVGRQTTLFGQYRQVVAAPGAKSAVSDCILFDVVTQ